jgi:UDP-glucose 4-epimerase
VHDSVRALMALGEHAAAEGEIFNIGRTDPISIDALARRVIGLTQSRSTLVHVPYSEAYAPGFEDMRRRVPDTRKIRDLTGWVPCKTLDQIILEVKAHIEARLESPRPQ